MEATGQRHVAFTLLEMLIAVSVITLLLAIGLTAVSAARHRGVGAKCSANLRGVGQTIHSFAAAHDDEVEPVVRERDYWWDRGEQRGWDIATGRWAAAEGGLGTIWTCPEQRSAYVGNARALGLDNRPAVPGGLLHRVGPRRWVETGRLVLAYDLQYNLLDNVYRHARDPFAGDLSDEMHGGWGPYEGNAITLDLSRFGPHRESYGVLFADGHASIGVFSTGAEALWWAGRPWWPMPSGYGGDG